MPYDSNGAWYDVNEIAPGFQGPYGSLRDQATAIATGMGETYGASDARRGARTVYDFAPIFDSGLNRANQMSDYVPPGDIRAAGGYDPLRTVFYANQFGGGVRQYNAWAPGYGGDRTQAIYNAYGGLGSANNSDMTNAEIAYYGVYGPYGDLRGNAMGATSYLNPNLVRPARSALQFLGQGGVEPRSVCVQHEPV